MPAISVATEISAMNALTPTAQKFILHWGEMGARWGINRTMAQIHAFLYLSEAPRHAEDICDALGVARSNVSNSLRELQNWGVVKVVHLPGDRRDHFETLKDVFEMFRVIAAERKKREVDPTVSLLRDCIAHSDANDAADAYTRQRLEDLKGFFELSASWFDKMSRMPAARVQKAMKLGDKVFALLGLGSD
jgi:DNA-binding transcriptional regulator GbsR (MarR family)